MTAASLFRKRSVKDEIFFGDFIPDSTALGPGLRSGIWVRGCGFRCPGCMTPEFIPQGRPEHVISVEDLYRRVVRGASVFGTEGITISGGEPFEQSIALSRLAARVRADGMSVIIWTGYVREYLERHASAAVLLEETDVLIDGPFLRERALYAPMRGSSNQRIHLLTNRYRREDFLRAKIELRLTKDAAKGVGPAGHAPAEALARLFRPL